LGNATRDREIVSALTLIVLVITAAMAVTYADFLGKIRSIEERYGVHMADLESALESVQAEASELRRQASIFKSLLEQQNLTDGALALSPETLYNVTIASTVQVTARSQGIFGTNTATGSGFVYSSDGIIVTNHHVVEGASSVQVTFIDGTTVRAELVGTDPYSDLAVLKVEASPFQLIPLSLANSSKLRVGQRVYAIGNPFGLSGSITEGIISQLGRSITTTGGYLIVDVIQTDAAINPGNSGGPLLNDLGEVVGVNTAIATTTGAFSGVGFAIPSNLVRRVVPSLIQKGFYKHPWIGVSGVDMTPEIAEEMGLNDARGFLITSVIPNSPAERAGLRGGSRTVTIDGQNIDVGGDVIVMVDGKAVRQIEDILSYIERLKVGETIQLRVVRDGGEVSVSLTLGERP